MGSQVSSILNLNIQQMMEDIGVNLNEKQKQVISSKKRFIVFRGGRRIGKSRTAAVSAMSVLLTPNTRTWIVAPSYQLAEKEFRYVVDFYNTLQTKFGLPPLKEKNHNVLGGKISLKTVWDSEVVGKSAERPESLLGEEIDYLILAETAQHKQDTWERYLRGTLSSRMGKVIFPTTPDIAGFWLYELEINAKKDPDNWDVISCAAWETDHYDKGEIELARKQLPEDVFLEQYGGEWKFRTGRVYPEFSQDIHVIEPFRIPPEWKHVRGIDFGFKDAFVCLWASVSPDGTVYFTEEYYSTEGKPTKVHAEEILLRTDYKPAYTVADSHGMGNQLMTDISRYGIPCMGVSEKSTSEGQGKRLRRDRLALYFHPTNLTTQQKPYHVRQEGNYPKIFFFNHMKETIKEFQFLRWRDSALREGNANDTAGADHAVSATEYIISTRPSPIKEKSFMPIGSFNHLMHRREMRRKMANYYLGYDPRITTEREIYH